VLFIDLEYFSELLETSYGPEQSKQLHLHYRAREIPYYPQGKVDDTHLSLKGATEIAKLVTEQLRLLDSPLVEKLKKGILK
jgi:lysophospholipase L1-like esterase